MTADADAGAGARLAELRRERQSRTDAAKLLLPVPGWSGRMVARYRPLTTDEVEAFKTAGDTDGVRGEAVVLVSACDAVYVLADVGDTPGEADRVSGGFDRKLAALFELDADSEHYKPADAAVAAFSDDEGRLNAMALTHHAMQVVQWMQDTSQQIDGALQGNS